MIGFFDSGFGGLQTMKYFHDLYPQYDYIFLADNKNCPFGNKSWDEIQKITFDALDWFFKNWAQIVIIACNTAAAYSIRKRQTAYPDKKALSVTIPGVEEILLLENLNLSIWVIATQATISSDIYNDLYYRFGWKKSPDLHFVMAPKLVELVESGAKWEIVSQTIQEYLSQFPKDLQALILACTHFSVHKDDFSKLFKWKLIDPSLISAQKFEKYLQNHPEIKNNLTTTSSVRFLTTGDTEHFNQIGSKIWDSPIKSEFVEI